MTQKYNLTPPRTLVLPENTKGRDFVVGDIHGSFDLLDQALLSVGFDPEKDRLIAVGDLIDRGTRSPDCVHYLSQPWFYSILGNHEEMFMSLFKDGKLDETGVKRNIRNGMGWMLTESTDTLTDIRAAFEKLPIAIEIKTPEGLMGFVHADMPQGMDWETFKQKLDDRDERVEDFAIWSRKRLKVKDTTGVDGIARVYFGHTPVEGGPKALGNCFYVDTGAVFKEMDPQNKQDLYMALVDIRANAADILNPAPTKNPLIKIATAGKSVRAPSPPKAGKPPAP